MSDERHSVKVALKSGNDSPHWACQFHRNIIALIIHVAQMMSVGN